MLEVEYRTGLEGLRGLSGDEIVALTRLATAATFYSVPLTKAQVAANERIPAISASAVFEAAKARHQHLVTAFIGGRLAGYMIATRHSKSDLELDWLMVDPAAHGSGLAASLMSAGLAWLELRPRTGRTHQVRVHCAELGCPVLGDPIYRRDLQPDPLAPLHLHARAIGLPLYERREPVRAVAAPPAHMAEALAACGYSPGDLPDAAAPAIAAASATQAP